MDSKKRAEEQLKAIAALVVENDAIDARLGSAKRAKSLTSDILSSSQLKGTSTLGAWDGTATDAYANFSGASGLASIAASDVLNLDASRINTVHLDYGAYRLNSLELNVRKVSERTEKHSRNLVKGISQFNKTMEELAATTSVLVAAQQQTLQQIGTLVMVSQGNAEDTKKRDDRSRLQSKFALLVACASFVVAALFSYLDYIGDEEWQRQQLEAFKQLLKVSGREHDERPNLHDDSVNGENVFVPDELSLNDGIIPVLPKRD